MSQKNALSIVSEDSTELEEAKDKIIALEKQVSQAEKRLALYEKAASARLYYALMRKQNEMADLLNESYLKNAISESDKSFERLRYLWNDAKDLVVNTKILGEAVGITGDEIRDTNKTITFLDRNAT
jgi:hypothetical protein